MIEEEGVQCVGIGKARRDKLLSFRHCLSLTVSMFSSGTASLMADKKLLKHTLGTHSLRERREVETIVLAVRE